MKSWLMAVAGAVVLAACEEGMDDLEQRVTEVQNRKVQAIEAIPQIKRHKAASYLPADRRDPFIPRQPNPGEAAIAGKPAPDLKRHREPLEEFALDELRMAGTIQAAGATYALIEAPDGVIHRVTIGNYLGRNFGRIKSIAESEIWLAEAVEDGAGSWVARPASLGVAE